MMEQTPVCLSGVRMFGSAIIRVAPDIATISVAVSRLEKDPKKSFATARSGAEAVQKFLKDQGIADFGSSRITLNQERLFVQGAMKHVGYRARMGFAIKLRELDSLEEVLSGLISAGADELSSVSFETTNLKQIRADARRQAALAAREKAELYCKETGVSLGKVIAIEDTNPDQLAGTRESHAAAMLGGRGGEGAVDPATITVGAAVYLTFEIVQPARD